jgi:hypothetical protein
MPSFQFDPARVAFEGSNFVIYDITDLLPKHPNYPHGTSAVKPNGKRAIPAHWSYGNRGQKVVEAFVHQTAGSYQKGYKGVFNTASFITRDPSYTVTKTDDDGKPTKWKWNGDGRGWPAMCYSYFFCYEPERTPDGKLIIFRCIPDDHKSWHTPSHNGKAIAFGFQGYFKSRHMGRFRPRRGDHTNGKPSQEQQDMLVASWEEYFKPTFGFTNDDVFGHFEAGKLACPGDELESWVLNTRDSLPDAIPTKVFEAPFNFPGSIELDSWERRQAALVVLGYDLGAYGPKKNGVDGDPGYKTRSAIEGLEESVGLPNDGVWDDRLEFLCQLVLFAMGSTQQDVDDLI